MKIHVNGKPFDHSIIEGKREADRLLRYQALALQNRPPVPQPLAHATVGDVKISALPGVRFGLASQKVEIIEYDGIHHRKIAGDLSPQISRYDYQRIFAAHQKQAGFYAIDLAGNRHDYYAGDFENDVLPQLKKDGFATDQ